MKCILWNKVLHYIVRTKVTRGTLNRSGIKPAQGSDRMWFFVLRPSWEQVYRMRLAFAHSQTNSLLLSSSKARLVLLGFRFSVQHSAWGAHFYTGVASFLDINDLFLVCVIPSSVSHYSNFVAISVLLLVVWNDLKALYQANVASCRYVLWIY